MLKKSLLFVLLLVLLASLASKAETLTVYPGNGSATNNKVPIYGSTTIAYKTEFIIPSSLLGNMVGGTITKLTFYSSNSDTQWNGTHQIWLKEVNNTTFSTAQGYSDRYSFIGTDGATKVYEGSVSVSYNKMILDISGFSYSGGNLLVCFYHPTYNNNYPASNFYGESSSSVTSIGATTSGYSSLTDGFHRGFMPKTTFEYCNTFKTAGNWNTASNWSMNSIPASTDDVIINAACTIPVDYIAQANNITLGTNGSITIEDGGQLVCNNAVQATMQKHITGYNAGGSDWYFIASPVAAGTTPSTENGLLNDNYDLFYYDQHTNRWINYKDDGDANTPNADPGFVSDGGKLLNGKGYLYASSEDIDLEFQGVLSNNGTVSLVYDEHAAPEAEGWNLVGNPFPCNAIANKDFYIINDNIANASTVATVISPCTGVMVQATDSDQNVIFTKAADQTPDLASADNGNIQITLAHTVASRGGASTSSVTIDNAIVNFNEGSRLEKFYFGRPAANIYIPQNHKEYAIVSAEMLGEMPMNFVANENGEYTITVNPENVQLNYLHLIDNLTGADVDLIQTPSYTFTAKTTDYESRFKLVFSANDMNDHDNENFAFIGSNGQLVVNGTGTLQIIDIMGRVIVAKSTEEHINTHGMTAGVYVLQLITGTETKTQKIIVK